SAIAVAGDSLVSGMNEANGAQQTRERWRVLRQRSLARYQMRNSAVLRRWHENIFTGRVASTVWAALIDQPFTLIPTPPAAAQIIAELGQSVTVPAGNTLTCTIYVALNAPGGTIQAPVGTFFTLNVFSNAVFPAGAFVPANTGGRIALNDGTINNPPTAGGIGAQGVIAQNGGPIPGPNININGSGFPSTALS